MLFIKHQQSQRAERQKNSRTCAHHHDGLIRSKTATPGGDALPVTATTVVFHNLSTKTLAATVHKLWDQSDLRREHQNVASGLQLSRSQLQIHLGFS